MQQPAGHVVAKPKGGDLHRQAGVRIVPRAQRRDVPARGAHVGLPVGEQQHVGVRHARRRAEVQRVQQAVPQVGLPRGAQLAHCVPRRRLVLLGHWLDGQQHRRLAGVHHDAQAVVRLERLDNGARCVLDDVQQGQARGALLVPVPRGAVVHAVTYIQHAHQRAACVRARHVQRHRLQVHCRRAALRLVGNPQLQLVLRRRRRGLGGRGGGGRAGPARGYQQIRQGAVRHQLPCRQRGAGQRRHPTGPQPLQDGGPLEGVALRINHRVYKPLTRDRAHQRVRRNTCHGFRPMRSIACVPGPRFGCGPSYPAPTLACAVVMWCVLLNAEV
mmetsp:Transcript_7502/g.19257  ORF Transcript_7502/g.19257 Transcript_7502/m.19257 type:complete len:329 (+) Transcript_7502:1432-2418(+)